MAVDRSALERRLREMEGHVRILQDLASRARESFVCDPVAFHAAQHLLQISVEGMISVGLHIVAELGLAAPETHARLIDILHAGGVLVRPDMLERYRAMTRFRNLVVHRYWEIDPARVHEILQGHLGNFGAFAREILEFLDRSAPASP